MVEYTCAECGNTFNPDVANTRKYHSKCPVCASRRRADVPIPNAHGSTHEGGTDALTLTSIDSLACRIIAIQFTGDGTLSQSIIGAGFQPQFVLIFNHEVGEITTDVNRGHIKIANMIDDMCYGQILGRYALQNRITSLDADGFTVDDGGADEHPNKLNQVYDVILMG